MAIGWNAMAEGFRGGFALGTEANEARTRKQALMMKMADERTEQLKTLIKTQLENANAWAENQAQNTPEYQQGVAALKAQIDDSISTLGTIPLANAQESAKALSQMINTSWPSIVMTGSERATRKSMQEFQGDMGMINALSSMQGGQQQVAAPQQPASVADSVMPQKPAAAPGMADQAELTQVQAAMPQGQQVAQAAGPDPRASLMERYLEKKYGITEKEKAITGVKMKRLEKMYDTADGATSALTGIARAEELLNEGIITGAGADWRKLASKYSGVYYTPEQIRRTEEFEAIMQEQVLKNIKPLGSSTAVSDTDRKFITSMVGADITLSEGGLRDILKHGKSAAMSHINKFNKEADAVGAPEMKIELPQFAPAAEDSGQAGQPGQMQPDEEGWIQLAPGVRMRAIQ